MHHDAVEIRTERLLLRPPRPGDAVRIADLINDFDITRMLSRVPFPYTLAYAEDFIAGLANRDDSTARTFAVEHPDFGVIGIGGLHPSDGPDPQIGPEIGYWLGRTFWGRGFATEMAVALTEWASRRWGRRAAVAGHFTDNPASGNVLEKAGFLYTGEVRPRFCVARDETVLARMMLWLA